MSHRAHMRRAERARQRAGHGPRSVHGRAQWAMNLDGLVEELSVNWMVEAPRLFPGWDPDRYRFITRVGVMPPAVAGFGRTAYRQLAVEAGVELWLPENPLGPVAVLAGFCEHIRDEAVDGFGLRDAWLDHTFQLAPTGWLGLVIAPSMKGIGDE